MLFSQIPTKFNIPFANNAGAGFITPIPQNSQIGISGGRASLFDGFPPLTFVPVGAGGIPPWGADFNGLFNQATAWCRWVGAGSPVKFDSTFSTAIGGYPQGALLVSTSTGNCWLSTVDNNNTDPDATPGAPGWLGVAFIRSVQNGSYISADDTGTADNYAIAPAPAPASYVKYQKYRVKIANNNLTTTPVLNVTGVTGPLGNKVIIHGNGTALNINDLVTGMIAEFLYDGANMQLENPANPTPATSGGNSAAFGWGARLQAFTVHGNYTWTVPPGVVSIYVRGWGAGDIIGQGGGWFEGQLNVTPGQVITVIVGKGGGFVNGSPVPSPNGNGGSSSFGNFATATGGSGGPNGQPFFTSSPGNFSAVAGFIGGVGAYFVQTDIPNPGAATAGGPYWQYYGQGGISGNSLYGQFQSSQTGMDGAILIWY